MLELKKYWNVYLVCGMLGAITFLVVFGPALLNPLNDSWLIGEKADLTQHYIGWIAYRHSAWTFPVGCMDNLAYPFETSVIFTDSIPLFAVLCKLFSPVLPDTFQYFGLYGFLCYVMQPVAGALLLKKYMKHKADIILGSVFFVLSPVLLARMYYHTALSGHFLLLFTMLGPVYYEEIYHETGEAIKLGALTAFLAASVHIYLLAMCGVIWLVYCILDLLKTKKIYNSVIVMSVYLLVSAGTVWLLGGFNGVFGAGRGGLGSYGLNINAFLNSQGNSSFLKGMKLPDMDTSEGYAYLGMGILVLAFLCCIMLIRNRKQFCEILVSNWQKTVAVTTVLVLVYLFSILPAVYLNDKLIFKLNLPHDIEKLWSVFRATGRFSWLIYYSIFMFVISVPFLLKKSQKVLFTVALGIALVIQLYDMTPQMRLKKSAIFQWGEDRIKLTDSCWQDIAQSGTVKHVYFGFSEMEYDIIYPVTEWAVKHGMTVNRFYFARSLDKEAVGNMLGDAMWEKNPDCIFIFRMEDEETCTKNGFTGVLTEDGLLLAGKAME